MRSTLLKCFLLFVIALSAKAAATGQTLIHYWHFNNIDTTWADHTPTETILKADFSIIDVNKTGVLYKTQPGVSAAYASYADLHHPGGSDTAVINWNSHMGQPTGWTFRARNPSDSMELLLFMPTTGYKNLALKFATETSSAASGMKYQLYDYSVDSGSTWHTTALSKIADTTITTYDSVTIHFSDVADPLVMNNPKFVFRIRFSGQDTGTSGNNRFDNFSLEGTPTTAVKNVNASAHVCDLFPNPATNVLNIHTDIAENKTIAVYSIAGQKVLAAEQDGNSIAIPVSTLAPGMYYITIRSTSFSYTTKFSKR